MFGAQNCERCARGRLGNAAPRDAVQGVAHYRAIVDGGKEAAGNRVEVAPRGKHLVTLRAGNLVARGLGQFGKRHIVGYRHQYGFAGIERELATSEQSLQISGHHRAASCVEPGQDGLNLDRVGFLGNLLAGQTIEVVGKLVLHLAGLQRHLASSSERAGQCHLAGGRQGQGRIGARQIGCVVGIKLCTRHHGAVTEQVNIGAALEGNVATVVTGGNGATCKQCQAGVCLQINGRTCAVVDTGVHACGAVNRSRSFELELAVGSQCLDGAAFVAGKAVDLGAVSDKAADTGALGHLDVDQIVGNEPAHDEHLLVNVDHNLCACHT